jgi:uncharacterized membrane protein YGL010W
VTLRTASEWFEEYGQSHTHPTNERLHAVCVPLIVLSVLGLLRSLPVPRFFEPASAWLNWATLFVAAALAYYSVLSMRLAAITACALALMILALEGLATLPWPLWATSVALFVVGWVGQFIGHAIEGRRPSFFKDVQFLLIGPLWLAMRWLVRHRAKY